jgi:4-amino-4-deoxy-L-arabinose transferase-like glycosyltransferase
MSATPPGLAASPPRWSGWTVIAVALLVRLVIVLVAPHRILWPDGREFEAIARNLIEHGTYGLQTLRPPGYPTVIAGVYRVFGPDLFALRLVEVVIGTATVGMMGAIGAMLFGLWAGLITMAMIAVQPVIAYLPATQFSENVLLFVLVPGLGATYLAARGNGLWRWALAGALLGLAALVRPNVLLLLPGLAVGFALWLHRERRAWFPGVVACGVAFALTLTPWIVRNHEVHHRWYFVATGGGRQFWFGNNAATSGESNTLTLPDTTMQHEMNSMPDDAARERYLYKLGMIFLREHPVRAAQLYGIKLGNLFALYPSTYSKTRFLNPASRVVQAVASLVIFAGALLALRRVRQTPALWPLIGAIVTFALTNAVFFTVMRYRLAFEPCLLWMAGFGWAPLMARRRRVNP